MIKNPKIPWSVRAHDFLSTEINHINKVIKNADPLTKGSHLRYFENNLKKFLKTKNEVYGVTSGSSAIELIALMLNLKKNDEIILPAATYCATALPFCRYGAKIRWVDIDLNTFNLDINHLNKLINNKTKAVVAVHLFGNPCDMLALQKICKKKKVYLVEDCAQGLGAKIKNKHVGNFSDFAVFSFHSQKNLTTLGEGGAILINNRKFSHLIPGLRHNGHRAFKNQKSYWKPAIRDVYEDKAGLVPFNFPLTEIQSAAGTKLLKRLPKLNSTREKRFFEFKKKLEVFKFIKFQKIEKDNKSSYHLLPIFFDTRLKSISRDKFINIMTKKYKVQVSVQYCPLYRYHFFKKYQKNQKCKNTDTFYDNMVSIPFYQWMSDKDFKYVINSTIKSLQQISKSIK